MFRLLLALLLFCPLTAQADERILDYTVSVIVEPSGDLEVTEHIQVQAEGATIKRGIFRDLIALVPGGYGFIQAPLEILNITRDGRPEPYHTKAKMHGLRVYLGDEHTYLKPGIYNYTLRYRMGWQIRQQSEKDELYWNVTGNDWAFPINQAMVSVKLPEGARILRAAAYVGPRGAKGSAEVDYKTLQVEDNLWLAQTLRPLATGEGLTVAIAFPKGVVPAQTRASWGQLLWQANPSLLVGLVGLCGLSLYFFLAWAAVGRDPARGPIIPIYTPRHSPAVLRYVSKMGFDQDTLIAGIVSLAVKGYLRIEQHSSVKANGDGLAAKLADLAPKTFTLVKTGNGHNASTEELELEKILFSGREELVLTKANRSAIVGILRSFQRLLDGRFSRENFQHNYLAYAIGLLLSVLLWWALTSFQGGEAMAMGGFMAIWLGFWSIGTAGLLAQVALMWRAVLRGSGWSLVPALFLSAFAMPFAAGWGMGAYFLMQSVGLVATVFLIMMALLNVCFYYLLKAPTIQGRGLMDEAEGVKLYLTVSENDRLKFFTPPDTPAVFERFLPYAVALDVQTQWTERFENVLSASQQAEGLTHTPQGFGRWYGGNQPLSSALAGGLTGALSTALTAASASNRSGSGGGGSSGGGSGGGGGGGW
jgi:uncharacterized membrane protein YgcG